MFLYVHELFNVLKKIIDSIILCGNITDNCLFDENKSDSNKHSFHLTNNNTNVYLDMNIIITRNLNIT